MTWVRLDDGFAEHPKILGLSNAAFRLHVAALCYSARQLTDGLITEKSRKNLRGTIKNVNELVDANLWLVKGKDHVIHDYEKYQPLRAKVLEERQKQAERQARSRKSHAVTDASVTDMSRRDNGVSHGGSHGVSHGGSHAVSHRTPTRPIPDLTTLGPEVKEQLEAVPRGLATAQESESQEEGFPL